MERKAVPNTKHFCQMKRPSPDVTIRSYGRRWSLSGSLGGGTTDILWLTLGRETEGGYPGPQI